MKNEKNLQFYINIVLYKYIFNIKLYIFYTNNLFYINPLKRAIMLLSYSIKNWKSIKEKCTIDFKAKSIKDHQDNKYHLLDNSILPIVAIYGPNGGGKSNFINSIAELINIIYHPGWLDQQFFIINELKNKDATNEPIEWELVFQTKTNKRIRYQISILPSNNSIEITNECLTIFENNKEKNFFCLKNGDYQSNYKVLENIQNNLNNKNSKTPMITFLKQFLKLPEIDEFWDEFLKIIAINQANEKSSNFTNNPNLFISKNPLFNVYMINDQQINFIDNNKKEILTIFKQLDINIIDIKINKIDQYLYSITSVKQSNFGDKVEIPFELESCGTRELFQLLLMFIKYIETDAIFFIDELDCHLHTKILRYIIKMFTNQKKTQAQLIYTSHDIPTLDKNLFRRDEIYFAALNESYFTDLISLNEFGDSIRNNQSYSKLYLDGKIGYDPYVDYSLKEFDNE